MSYHRSKRVLITPNVTFYNTVRTTGTGSSRISLDDLKMGVYWGAGDPRNTITESTEDTPDLVRAELRSIAMALEQAKKDGLKRVRVQTDFYFKESAFWEEMQKHKCFGSVMENGVLLPNSELFEKILEYMNEMEVIIEHRKAWSTRKNEVMDLLMAEKNKPISD